MSPVCPPPGIEKFKKSRLGRSCPNRGGFRDRSEQTFAALSTNKVDANFECLRDVFWVANHVHHRDASAVQLKRDWQ